MFNSFAGLQDTVERVAAFSLAGEAVADYLIELMLDAPGVPEWLKAPYRLIHEDEAEHGNYPARSSPGWLPPRKVSSALARPSR